MKLVFLTFVIWLMATGKFAQYLAFAAAKAGNGETAGQAISQTNGMVSPGFTDSTIAAKTLIGALMPSVAGAGSFG